MILALAAAVLGAALAAEPAPSEERRVQLSAALAWHLRSFQLEAAWLGPPPWRLSAGAEGGLGLLEWTSILGGHLALGGAWALPGWEPAGALRLRVVVEGGGRVVYERVAGPARPPAASYAAVHLGLLSTTGLELSWRWPWLDVVLGAKAAVTLLPGAGPALMFPNIIPAPPLMWPLWAPSPAWTTPLGRVVLDVRASAGAAF